MRTKTMKRPLPTTPTSRTTALTLLLFLSSSSLTNARKEDEECTTLLTMATQSDTDASGGLSRLEFTQFWNGLSGTSNIVDGDGSNALSQLVADTYSSILCECHETFGFDEQCCDDTATDDSISSQGDHPGPGKHGNEEIWTEISLQGLEDDARRLQLELDVARKPNWYQKEYRKKFCEWVESAMEEVGVELGETVAVEAVVTEAATTTVAPTTTKATAAATTTEAEEEAVVTVFWKPTATDPPDVLDIITTTTTTTTLPATTTATTTTTTTTTAETTTTTTESSNLKETSTTPSYAPTIKGPITLSFLGSTNGKVNANFIDLEEEATNVLMRVALDVVGDMDIVERERQRRGRELEIGDYVEEAAVYFESVVMDVEDVECPDGLAYAAKEAPCLEFTYTLTPLFNGPLDTFKLAKKFTNNFYKATNDNGALYDALVEEYPDTEIVGLGSPGKGIPLGTDGNMNANQSILLQSKDGTIAQSEVQQSSSSSFPVGAIIGAVLAVALLALVVMALFVKKRRSQKQLQQELNDSNLSEDLEANEVNDDAANVEDWLDEEDEDDANNNGNERQSGSSTLAVMGMASTVATRLSTGDTPKSPTGSSAAMGMASTVATRLSTGDTEVFMTEKQAWSKNEPSI